MIAYKDFIQTLRDELWPAGEPRSLRTVHTKFFLVAMIRMQRDFEILRKNHVSVFPFQTKYFDCGKTLVGAPWGKINQVYTIANSTNWCDKVYYGQTSYDAIVHLSRFLTVESPANTGLPALPQGIRMEEASTDLYSGGISMRARTGLWANHNKKIWVFPWLQSNESLVIEWDGNKAEWTDDDAIDDVYWHADVQHLVKLIVEREHEFRFGDPRRVLILENEIGTVRAQLLLDERENTWLRKNQGSLLQAGYIPSKAQTDAQAIPVIDDSITFAAIADSGENDANQNLVAALLEADIQDFLIIAGDVSYGDPYADVVTAKYPSYPIIKPSRGNHDYDINNGADFEAFFTALENNGVTHEYVIGPAHFLFVPSDPREATLGYIDATTSIENGPIGQYIKAKFLLSPAKWKFLVFHHSSYTSGSSHGSSLWMDMDFNAMGLSGKIDGIFMGHSHNFEVAIKNGYRYITNGLGGKAKNGFGAPVAGSVIRYSADYGALFNRVNPTTWHYEFRNTAGTVIYQEDVTK